MSSLLSLRRQFIAAALALLAPLLGAAAGEPV